MHGKTFHLRHVGVEKLKNRTWWPKIIRSGTIVSWKSDIATAVLESIHVVINEYRWKITASFNMSKYIHCIWYKYRKILIRLIICITSEFSQMIQICPRWSYEIGWVHKSKIFIQLIAQNVPSLWSKGIFLDSMSIWYAHTDTNHFHLIKSMNDLGKMQWSFELMRI